MSKTVNGIKYYQFGIRECRRFLKEQSTANYPNIYEYIRDAVRKYDNHDSQYLIKDNRQQ